MDNIDVYPDQTQQPEYIDIFPEGVANPVQGNVAKERALKYDVAMGPDSPGANNLQASITDSQEDNIRDSYSKVKNIAKYNQRVKDIVKAAKLGQDPRAVASLYTDPVATNPKTVMETSFADWFTNNISSPSVTGPEIQAAMAANPAEASRLVSGTRWLIAMREIALKAHEDADARNTLKRDEAYPSLGPLSAPGTTFLQRVGDIGAQFVPLLSGANKAPTKDNLFRQLGEAVLAGSTMEEERAKFFSFRDPDMAQAWLESRIKQIEANNPLDALEYARQMVHFSRDDKVVGNVFGGIDLLGLGAGVAVKGAAAAQTARYFMRKYFKDAVQATADGTVRMENIAAATGDLDRAATIKTAKRFLQEADPAGVFQHIVDELPSSFNPTGKFSLNPGGNGRERSLKLGREVGDEFADMIDTATRTQRLPRVPHSAYEPMLQEAKARVFNQYPSVADGFLDAEVFRNQSNNALYGRFNFGKSDGRFFDSEDQLNNYAQRVYGIDYRSIQSIKTDQPDIMDVVDLARATQASLVQPLYKGKFTKAQIEKTIAANEKSIATMKSSGNTKNVSRIEATNKAMKDWISSQNQKVAATQVPISKNNAPAGISEAPGGILAKGKQGNKWYFSIIKPLDETSPIARQSLLDSTNTNPATAGAAFLDYIGGVGKGVINNNRFLSSFKSANDQLAPLQRGNRKIALHSAGEMQRLFADHAAVIGNLSGSSRKKLDIVLEANKNDFDFNTKDRGYRFESPAKLEQAWVDAHGTPPTLQEQRAYWTYHNMMDTDWVLRNFGVSRDLTRQGIERITIRLGSDDLGKDFEFNGRIKAEGVNWHDRGDPGYLIITNNEPVRHLWLSEMKEKANRPWIDGLMGDGYKVLEVGNPTERPFKDATGIGSTVNKIIIKEFNSRPLDLKLVDYNPGVHVIYPHEHSVKVPIVGTIEKGRRSYYGDQTLFLTRTEKEARRQAGAINELGDMIRAGKSDAELNAFIHKNLPEDAVYWRATFDKFPNLHEFKAHNVYSGHTVLDTHPQLRESDQFKGLINERESEYNLYRSIDMDFLADRNGPAQTITMSPEQPIYRLETAKTVGAYDAITRALNNSIRNFYFNDAKISAIEQWVAQNAKYLNYEPEFSKANPFQAFYQGKILDTGSNHHEVVAAINSKDRITQFLGINTDMNKDLRTIQNHAMNFLGEKWGGKYQDNERKFMAINDPISFTRKWMFDYIFGFFNPKQFMVQAQGFIGTYGIMVGAHGPIEGTKLTNKAMGAYAPMAGLYFTDKENIRNYLVKIAVSHGWTKEQFWESYNLMRNMGWDNIGSEHAFRDHVIDPKIISTGKQSLLEMGRTPFREGERIVRINAWNAAYLEFRKKNPTATISDFDANAILERADDLAFNMTRASNSRLQEGYARLPAQFYTFSERQMNLYFGNRLTGQEKAGLFATQSVMYGVPAALGAVTLYPVYEELEKYLQLKGSPIADSTWYKTLTQGWLGFMMYHVTGAANWITQGEYKGTWYNVGQRYGPGPGDRLSKFLRGDIDSEFVSPLFEAAMGASGTFIDNMLSAAYPFHTYVINYMSGADKNVVITKEDWIRAAREVSSVNDVINSWNIVSSGKYWSKRGSLVAQDQTVADGVAMMMGFTRADVQTDRLRLEGVKGQQEQQRFLTKFIERELGFFYRAQAEGETEKAKRHLHNATIYTGMADLNPQQQMEIHKRMAERSRSLQIQARDAWLKGGKASQIPARQKLFNEQRKQQ